MKDYRYPCTGNISMEGFGAYMEKEIGEPRRNIRLFADELNRRLGSQYMTLTNSGSSANLVAALALAEKCKAAGKPLTAYASAFTFPTTVSALLLAGFKIHLLDIEQEGFNIDPALVTRFKYPASVIAVTHFLGFPCKVKEICDYAHSHGSFVLQDACETFGLDQEWQYGDMTTLSFYHPHHLSSYGGGAVICNDKQDYALCDSIAHWGRACKCHIDESLCSTPDGPAHQFTYDRLGVNVEMSELNACFGRWQLRDYASTERRRIRNYELLYRKLDGKRELKVWAMQTPGHSPFVFPIKLTNGMGVHEAWERLSRHGVEIRTLMGGATFTQPAFTYNVTHDEQANALAMADTTFFVGIHHTLPPEDVSAVAEIIDTIFM